MNARRSLTLHLFISLVVALATSARHAQANLVSPKPSALVSNKDKLVTSSAGIRHNWYFNGEAQGDDLGAAVSAAGDVNGDGWDDVIVGAPKAGDLVTKEGIVYIFFGSSVGLNDSPGWKVGGGQQGAGFGAAVSAAGDVNGDGWDDVIVGAPLYGQPETGRVFIFYGSDTVPSLTPDWTFEIGQRDAKFGISVGAAGDVNDDNYDDVMVGAQGYKDGQESKGAAFCFYGSASGITTTYWMTESNQVGALFGSSVSTAGDVDGDGYDDVIVGASQFDDGETDEGAAFVFLGSDSGLPASYAWMAGGDQAEAEFGAAVNTAGDVNGDGLDDVIVGAPLYDADQPDAGAAFGFYSSETGLSASADWSVMSDQSWSGFGSAVATAGDVNGDAFDDVIVGAYRYSKAEEGQALIFFGSTSGLSETTNWVTEGDKAETQFGFAVGAAGDVNGDGYADVIVGSPKYKIETDTRGRAFAYHGSDVLQFFTFLPCVFKAFP